MPETRHESRTRLLDAAVDVVRAKGYAATRVDDICAAAGLTKGSFFHHFAGKEDLAVAAAARWNETASAAFAAASYRALADPLDRLLGYVDFRKALLVGDFPNYTCFAGTMVQEVYRSHPAIRDACAESIGDHIALLEPDIDAAIARYGIDAGWTARSLALHTHAVVQGAFVLAKTMQDTAVAAQSLDHLRRYLELLFRQSVTKERPS